MLAIATGLDLIIITLRAILTLYSDSSIAFSFTGFSAFSMPKGNYKFKVIGRRALTTAA